MCNAHTPTTWRPTNKISISVNEHMKQRIHIDISVIGGYFDIQFKEPTVKFFERFDNNEVIFVVSDLPDLYLLNAPKKVWEHL